MADLKIKKEKEKTILAFGKGGGELGKRSQADLTQLAIIAHQSGDQSIIDLFEGELPPLEELQKKTTEKAIKAGNRPAVEAKDGLLQPPNTDKG